MLMKAGDFRSFLGTARRAVLVSLLLCGWGRGQVDFAQPGESAEFVVNTITQSASIAAVSAGEFDLDTRAITPEMARGESGLFPIDTRAFGNPPPLTIAGHVAMENGVPLSGATIRLLRYGSGSTELLSAADGSFLSAPLIPQSYTVQVSRAGFIGTTLNLDGRAGGLVSSEIVLRASPLALPTTEKGRTATTSEAPGPRSPLPPTSPHKPRLLMLQNGGMVPAANLNPNAMTIIITHGWTATADETKGGPLFGADGIANSGDEWERFMAYAISLHQVLGTNGVNILCWDWHRDASGKANPPSVPVWNTPVSGQLLGSQLQQLLGSNYHQKLHFIGHSLGALVNRYAVEYLHGVGPVTAALPWDSTQTKPHLTLLDEAEVASFGGHAFAPNASWMDIASQLADEGCNETLFNALIEGVQDYKSPIPNLPAADLWIDNYISLVGYPHLEALNICLLGPTVKGLFNLAGAHAYAHEWYDASFSAMPLPSVGLLFSREAGMGLPPFGDAYRTSHFWHQELSLEVTPGGLLHPYQCFKAIMGTAAVALIGKKVCDRFDATVTRAVDAAKVIHAVFQGADAVGRKVMDGYMAGIQFAGDKLAIGVEKTGQVLTSTTTKVGEWIDASRDAGRDAWAILKPESILLAPLESSTPCFILQHQLPLAAIPLRPAVAANESSASTEPRVWLSVSVPTNAIMLAFDFTVRGNVGNDCIACAVNGQNVFNLPANVIPKDAVQSTDPLDISTFAGQTIELYFGLTGGTSPDCTLEIDGIRFVTIPQPTLVMTDQGDHLELNWPAAAVGWFLETSPDLTAGSWQEVIPDQNSTVANGVMTCPQPRTTDKNFYRLHRRD